MSKRYLKHAVLSLLVTCVLLVALTVSSSSAAAQTQPSGCQSLNDPLYDSLSIGTTVSPLNYVAGQQIVVMASPPFEFGAPEVLTLSVNDEPVASASYPATVNYTIPADGSYSVNWTTEVANVAWTVSCDQRADLPADTTTSTPKEASFTVYLPLVVRP